MLHVVLMGLVVSAPDAGASRSADGGTGRLRVLVRLFSDGFLPPQANPEATELELLEAFAARQHLVLERVAVERFDELIPALLEGRGDVIAAGLTVTPERQKLVAFTRPTEVVDELLVARAQDGGVPRDVAALSGATVHVPHGSAFVDTLEALRAKGVGLVVEQVEGAFPPDQLAWEVSRGTKRFTVVDSRRFEAIAAYTPGLVAPFAVATNRPIAFAVKREDAALRSRLDAFLMERSFLEELGATRGDLDDIRKRGALRLLTRNNAVTFYLHKGERRGFDYELAKLFAKQLGVRLEVVVAPSYDALLPMLEEGRGDLIAASFLTRRDVRRALVLSSERPIAFAVRRDSPALLAALDGFVKKTFRGLEYNVIKKRCFENRQQALVARTQDSFKTGSLSPFDGLIKKYSRLYGFDWRLMSAQAWRESHFDPKATSWVGAQGLFQVMPATGKEMGFSKLYQAETGTHAGIKYMSTLLKRFPPALPLDERVRFSLAAYNAGFGRVEDARRLAVELGLDPDTWRDNVERSMALLARPKYARRVRGGFCRCQEPVDYVNVIENKYQSFAQLVPEE